MTETPAPAPRRGRVANWQSRGGSVQRINPGNAGRALVTIDTRGRIEAMIRECVRRELWNPHVELLQKFLADFQAMRMMPRGDALQVIDRLVEDATSMVAEFEMMQADAASIAAFIEISDLADGIDKVRAAFEGGRRGAGRHRWRISIPAERNHLEEIQAILEEAARRRASA